MNRYFYTILCLIIITGCATTQNNDPIRINASSANTYTKTLSKMMRQLSDKERFNFQIAMLKINLEGVGSAIEALDQNKLQANLTEKSKSKIDGLTYQEIIALADSSNSVSISIGGSTPGLPDEFKTPLESNNTTPYIDLAGTSWEITSNGNGHISKYIYKFVVDGTLLFEKPKIGGVQITNTRVSRWQQEGNDIRITINNNYSIKLGHIKSPTHMKGKSSNIRRYDSTWEASLIVD